MGLEREIDALAAEMQLFRETLQALIGRSTVSSDAQLTLAGVADDLAERTAVQMGAPEMLERTEGDLRSMMPPGDGVAVTLGGLLHDGALSRWHRTQVRSGFDGIPVDDLVAFLRPASNEQRLGLVRELGRGVRTTGELQEATGMTGGQFYHHLTRLASAGYISRVRQGHYTLSTRGKVAMACLGAVCSLLATWPEEIGERLAQERLADSGGADTDAVEAAGE